MSIQGILLIDLVGLGLIILILNLVRTHELHVGYAAAWLVAVTALMVIISVPQLLAAVTVAVGAVYPASALSLLGFIFIFVVLVVFSMHLTLLSSRQVKLIQALALRELQEAPMGRAEAAHGEPSSQPGLPAGDLAGG
jgi:hypothetical protein